MVPTNLLHNGQGKHGWHVMRNYKVRTESLDFVTFRSKIGGYTGRWLGIPNCSDCYEKSFLHTSVLSLGTSEDPNRFGSRRFPLEYSPQAGKPWVSRGPNLNTLQQAKLDFDPQKCKNIITRTSERVRCSSSQDSKYPWVLQVCTIKAPNDTRDIVDLFFSRYLITLL